MLTNGSTAEPKATTSVVSTSFTAGDLSPVRALETPRSRAGDRHPEAQQAGHRVALGREQGQRDASPSHIQPVTSSRIANRPELTALAGCDQFRSHSPRSIT